MCALAAWAHSGLKTFNLATQWPPSGGRASSDRVLWHGDSGVYRSLQKDACCPSGSHRPGCISQPYCLLAGWGWVEMRDGLQWIIPLSGLPRLHGCLTPHRNFPNIPASLLHRNFPNIPASLLQGLPSSHALTSQLPGHSVSLTVSQAPASSEHNLKIQAGGPFTRPASGALCCLLSRSYL